MNKVVCAFNDGSTHTFASPDPERARTWFERLWEVKEIVSIRLVLGGCEVAHKSLYKTAV